MKNMNLLHGALMLFFLLGSLSQTAYAQPVRPLTLDCENSKIRNKTTEQVWTCAEFVLLADEERTYLAGHELRFEFVLVNTHSSASIPSDYRIDLSTNLDNPQWAYLDNRESDPEWEVWNTDAEHNLGTIRIELDGIVPQPVSEVTEPYFKGIEGLLGICKRDLFVRVDVRDKTRTIQELTNDIRPRGTNEDLENNVRIVKETLLTDATDKIRETFKNPDATIQALVDLKEDTVELAEQGHPGWAYVISQDLRQFDVSMGTLMFKEPDIDCNECADTCCSCPWILFIAVGIGLGVLVGIFLGKVMTGKKVALPGLEDQIEKIEGVRKRIQEIREDDSKRKIELIGPESELKDIARRMESINSDLHKLNSS